MIGEKTLQLNILSTMRGMAWERAKGELKSILQTYFPEYSPNGGQLIDNGFDEAEKLINDFIENFEDIYL